MKLNDNIKTLESENLFLKPFTAKDIQAEYINWLNNNDINKYLEIRLQKQTTETAKAYVNSFKNNLEKFLWGIYSLDNKLIGTTSLYNFNKYHGLASISIMIGNKDFWGTSATIEAKTLVINYAFNIIKIRKILASTYAVNMSMNFTLKKLGFTLEGKFLQNRLLENGEYCDEFKWGLFKNVWQQRSNF